MVEEFFILNKEIKGPLNLKFTMESEQFTNSNWGRIGEKYRKVVKIKGKLVGLEVWQEGSVEKPKIHVKIYCKNKVKVEDFKSRIIQELGLNYDLEAVYDKLENDAVSKKLINQFRGLRLVRYLNLEECLITYQLSANTMIKRLEQMCEALKQRFCEKFRFDDGMVLAVFPTVKHLSKATLKDFEECKLGYKAKPFFKLVKTLTRKPVNWEKLGKMDIVKAKRILMDLPGVGEKVADAVLLYGLSRTEVLPIDVWVRRTLIKLYGLNPNSTYKQLQNFVKEKFGEFSGYFGPYLFYYGRTRKVVLD